MANKKPTVSALFDKLMAEADRLPVPQLADISAAFIHEMGGPGALAKMMAMEYHAAKPGSVTRAKILDPVLRGLRREAELPPVGQLDDERLRKLLASTLKEFAELDGEAAGPTAEHAGQPGAAEADASPQANPAGKEEAPHQAEGGGHAGEESGRA